MMIISQILRMISIFSTIAALMSGNAQSQTIPTIRCGISTCLDTNSWQYREWERQQRQAEEDKKRKQQEDAKRKREEEARDSAASSLAAAKNYYQDLLRRPEAYAGQVMSIRGKVVQVQIAGNVGILRMNITPGAYNVWSDTIWVDFRQDMVPNNKRILEGDIVRFRGRFRGLKSYTAVLGQHVQIPQIAACEIRAIEGTITVMTEVQPC